MKSAIFFMIIFLATTCNTKSKTHVVANKENGKIESETFHDSCYYLLNKLPDTFSDFNLLYGFDDKNGAGKYYSRYEKDLGEFFSCDKISIDQKLSKSIGIGISGKWDADAIGMLQNETVKLIIQNPKEASKILNTFSENKASSFWFFILDGPHPLDDEKKEIFKKLLKGLGVDSHQWRLLAEEGEKINIRS